MKRNASCTVLAFLAQAPFTLAFVSPVQQSVGRVIAPRSTIAKPTFSQNPFSMETCLYAEQSPEEKSKLPFLLDPGTKGGALFLSLVLFIVPIIFYNVILAVSDVDELDLGRWIGVGFTAVATVAWLGTYLFRVVTKDMTYAKQLKDYENAVIAKRLEELDEDELQALVEEVDKDDF